MTPSTTTRPMTDIPATTVTVWRDHDEVACGLPGMGLGDVELPSAPELGGAVLWELGARRVRLHTTIDLTSVTGPDDAARAVRLLCLVRDLTARAVLVDWRLRLGTGPDDAGWRTLSHLQPPAQLDGPLDADTALADWRATHYLCKCVWRRGPGFVQVRDRRWGDLRRFTVDEPEYQEVIEQAAYGVASAAVPAGIAADLAGEQLVGVVGDLLWWMPYRVQRWIQEAMAI